MKNHRGLGARWHEAAVGDSENSSRKSACAENKSSESMLFLSGLVQQNRNNLILRRSNFEEWLSKCKINASIEKIRQKPPAGSGARDLATSRAANAVLWTNQNNLSIQSWWKKGLTFHHSSCSKKKHLRLSPTQQQQRRNLRLKFQHHQY